MIPPRTSKLPPLPESLARLLGQRIASDRLQVPLLPESSARVVAACEDEACDARRVAELIQMDPALVGHVLRTANSVAYAPKEPIVSLQQAVSRIGMGAIRHVVVDAAMKTSVFVVPGYEERTRPIWIHSAIAGHFAKEIARLLRRDAEVSFLAGLMHDVGKPIVLQGFVDVLRERTAREIPPSLLEAGMAHFHAQAGARLVEHWRLPGWLAMPIRYHHDYDALPPQEVETRITHLADLLAHWAVDAKVSSDYVDPNLPVLEDLGIDEHGLEFLLSRRGSVLEAAEVDQE